MSIIRRILPLEIVIDMIERLPMRTIIAKAFFRTSSPCPMTNEGFFATLPLEIVIDIIARLPVRTIISCKCVCKSWLRLIKSHEFYKFHLSKAVPLLAVHHYENMRSRLEAYSFLEIEEVFDCLLYFNHVVKINLPEPIWTVDGMRGSVNGLLLLLDKEETHELFVICNPITRQYIRIYHHPVDNNHWVTIGFGASKITGQLKVVRILEEMRENLCEVEVYTLGTRAWRRIAHAAALKYRGLNEHGSFLNGNLHWSVEDLNGNSSISCFDLETELFTTFSLPDTSGRTSGMKMVAPLGDFLCLCEEDIRSNIIIWLMKEYGVEKSWTKEFVIDRNTCMYVCLRFIMPIKVLSDGGLLIVWAGTLGKDIIVYSVHYSKKDEVSLNTIGFNGIYVVDAIFHTPSFFCLESFVMEDVRSF